MYVELNIGLNVEGKANTNAERSERALQAVAELVRAFRDVEYRRETSEYEGPNGNTVEDTLVVRCQIVPLCFQIELDTIENLAAALEQDCIAVRFPTGFGDLLGPNAAKYGAFNPGYFIRFEGGERLKEAAAA